MDGVYHATQDTVANQQTGYASIAYIGLMAEMDSIAAPTGPFANPEDASIISGDHTFTVVGDGFVKCYTLPTTNEGTSESFGEPGAINIMSKHKFFWPGDTAKLQQMLKTLMNRDLIVLVEDATNPDGPVFQYGDRKIACNVSNINFTSGTGYDGKKGYAIEVQVKEKYTYAGTITEMQ